MNIPLAAPSRIVTLGGSDAAAAAGIDPYCSRVMLWLEKTGRIERPETEAMRWGTLLEPLVKDELRERGYAVTDSPADAITDEARAWLRGHPDGFARQTDDFTTALLEVKTASPYAHRTGEVPIQYAAQVQTYLHLTGLDRALLATLVGGQRLEIHELERDDDAIAMLLALMEETHGYIVRDEPPPPDGSESAREAIGALYAASDGGTVRATAEVEALVRELRARKSQLDAVKEQARELENRLKLYVGNAETLIDRHDVKLATWKRVPTTRVDAKRLKTEAPHVHANYAVTTETRRLTIT